MARIKTKYIVIIGCGRLGSLLANRLSGLTHQVVVIDSEPAKFDALSSGEFTGFRIIGDAVELETLREANIEKADCLLAVTNDDNVNLMVAQIAKNLFQVEKVVARVYDPAREAIYRKFGIEIVSPTLLSADAFMEAFESIEAEKEKLS